VVICIAPFPELGGMQMEHINHNLSGIACILEVQMEYGNINFLFAGDMEKYTVERLICNYDDYNYIIPNVYNYIKIPHHGSEDAYNLTSASLSMERVLFV
jgi:beta-lactamase superfamily II metal-dependent hydrolase